MTTTKAASTTPAAAVLAPQQPSSTTSSASVLSNAKHDHQPPRHHRRQPPRWTHANSDAHCLRPNAGRLRRWLYAINLHTALYMLSARERAAAYLAFLAVAAATAVVTAVFVQGMVDGFYSGCGGRDDDADYCGAYSSSNATAASAAAALEDSLDGVSVSQMEF